MIAGALISTTTVIAPPQAHAVDEDEALKICLAAAALTGNLVIAAGCAAGYALNGATSEGTYPKFNFIGDEGNPWSGLLGADVFHYEPGRIETLKSGLWKGCPPDCMKPPELVSGREDVVSVVYSIISTNELNHAESFEAANWIKLGDARFNAKSYRWELPWNTSGFSDVNGYVFRADFKRRNGNHQIGVGIARMRM